MALHHGHNVVWSTSHGRSSGIPETSMTTFTHFFCKIMAACVLVISLKPEIAAALVLEVCQLLRL